MHATAPSDRLRVALAQLDPLAGDVSANVARLRTIRAEATAAGADLIIAQTQFLSGNRLAPATDPAVVAACTEAVEALAADTLDGGPAIVVGTPWPSDGRTTNALAILDGGRIEAVRHEVEPATRGPAAGLAFAPAPMAGPVGIRGVRVGLLVDGDLDGPDVADCLGETGADLLVAVTVAPHRRTAAEGRMQAAVARVVETGLPLVCLHRLGGGDGEVHVGGSFCLRADRSLAIQLAAFEEALTLIDCERRPDGGWDILPGDVAPQPEGPAAEWSARCLGLRDHARAVGRRGAVVDLSDPAIAALPACLSMDVFGAAGTRAVSFGGAGTEPDHLQAARSLADRLGIRLAVLDIGRSLAALVADAAPAATLGSDRLRGHVRALLCQAIADETGGLRLLSGGAPGRGDPDVGFAPFSGLGPGELDALAAWRLSGEGSVTGPEPVSMDREASA